MNKEDFEELRKKAEQGDATAQCSLGTCYEGRGEVKNVKKAIKWWTKAAEQGNVEAQLRLARTYEYGTALDTALDWIGSDRDEAFKWYKMAAEQGSAEAQYKLGVTLTEFYGEPQDKIEAVKWYRRAAEQGFAPALYRLGISYMDGVGVAQDCEEAVRWFKKAENSEFTSESLGLREDIIFKCSSIAVEWVRKAAKQGSLDAIEGVDTKEVLRAAEILNILEE